MLLEIMPTLFVVLCCPPQGSGAFQFQSAAHTGDMQVSTVSDDRRRAYVSEADQVSILDISTPSSSDPPTFAPLIAKVPVNASILAMVRHDYGADKALFIAGGSFGLLKMKVTNPFGYCDPCNVGTPGNCYEVNTIDDRRDPDQQPPGDNEKWCWDVCIADVPMAGGFVGKFVVALFSAQDDQHGGSQRRGSELRIYQRSTMALVARVDLHAPYANLTTPIPTAFGWGLGVKTTYSGGTTQHGSTVFVAMGTGGVIRVDLNPLAQLDQPSVTLGSIFDQSLGITPPLALTQNDAPVNGTVCDIAVASDDTVYAAVDAWGIAQLDPATGTVLLPAAQHVQSLDFGDPLASPPTHFYGCARRVKTVTVNNNQVIVIVGGEKIAAVDEFQAPFAIYGRFSYRADTGGDLGYKLDGPTANGRIYFPSGLGTPSEIVTVSNVDESCGNFTVRPESSGSNFWIYEQATWYGGSAHLRYPYHDVIAGFQAHKVVATDYSDRVALYHSGIGECPLSLLEMTTDPGHLLLATEGGVGANPGSRYVDITTPTCVVYSQDPTGQVLGGSVFGIRAHWGDAQEEWWVSAREQAGKCETGFRLNRAHAGVPVPEVDQWLLRSPRQPDCYLARNYHRATDYIDPMTGEHRVIGTFQTSAYGVSPVASPWAGVLYSVGTLVGRAQQTPPLRPLFPDPPPICGEGDGVSAGTPAWNNTDYGSPNYIAPVMLHPELVGWSSVGQHDQVDENGQSRVSVFTGECKVVNYTVDNEVHAFAIVAAGSESNDTMTNGQVIDQDYEKAMLVLVDLDSPYTLTPSCPGSGSYPPTCYRTKPGPLHVDYPSPQAVVAPQTKGMATALEIVNGPLMDQHFAFVTDFGGRLHIFDVSDPMAPTYRQSWVLPVDVLDGYIDNVFDIEIDEDNLQSDQLDVYITAARVGIIRLRILYNPAYDPNDASSEPWNLPPENYTDQAVLKIDTPGLAHALLLKHNTDGSKQLIMTDKQGGLRIYSISNQ